MLTTGRVVHHFHTRTKTGRSRALVEAAPDAFVQIAESDARLLGIGEGELVRVTSRRGSAEAPARIGGMQPVEVFMPFHYGTGTSPAVRAPRTSSRSIAGTRSRSSHITSTPP
jgi:predicted molibdopterin-dependent oxidoreductase YjgC